MTTSTLTGKTRKITDIHLGTSPLHLKRILFATDFSSPALASFKVAVQLSRHFGGRLYMTHVISPMLYAAGGGVVTPALQEVEIRRAHEKLTHYFARLPQFASIKREGIVTCGQTKELIREIVEEKHIDLVAMGSHGRGGIRKLALGSVAESALRLLRCPALICGPECARSYRPFKSILLATGLSIGSLRSAQYASALAEEFHAHLTIVHVVPPDTPKNESIHRGQRQQHVAAIGELVPAAGESRKHTQYSIQSGDPVPELLRIAKLANANLIVMGAREGGPMADHAPWATVSRVIREARCPVLAIQPHFG
jgi:nucleotide-binding universal stress UspA family protein